ncbi:hypothetical protein [Pontibacter rugosus]
MQFTQIIGHQEAKQLLLKSVQQNHVAHAQLFLGQEEALIWRWRWPMLRTSTARTNSQLILVEHVTAA